MSEQRPRSPRMPRAQRRAQLLAVALEAFSLHGYHKASMDDIAEAAGVSKPVLYQHFPGKRELYLALVDDNLEGLAARLIEALRSSPVNRTRVESMLSVYFDFVADQPQAYRLIFESDLLADPEIRTRFENFHVGVAEAIGSVLGPNAGLSQGHAVMLSRSLTAMAEAGASYWAHHAEVGDRAEAERQVFRLAWGGISIIDEDWT
ncbi:TetR/AcrR family transcriptional regulator [Kocuria sp. JC486]|uniref:TetR/AcrR family transcriptional regulator n=1 Tax=Kocuria soli TaxID=2485125 RepID=A0A3N4A2P3_9MICC|nr:MULTISPECIES: TetR/AcrR family transcriptional regulator [Kocuria]NHU84438.1 TetR/AcrR family transcriptional regulator [Kocuria sp. JC486]ROZ62649.1 TetR/AcrR family transcriptional regulator [Kocuria soli]